MSPVLAEVDLEDVDGEKIIEINPGGLNDEDFARARDDSDSLVHFDWKSEILQSFWDEGIFVHAQHLAPKPAQMKGIYHNSYRTLAVKQ